MGNEQTTGLGLAAVSFLIFVNQQNRYYTRSHFFSFFSIFWRTKHKKYSPENGSTKTQKAIIKT